MSARRDLARDSLADATAGLDPFRSMLDRGVDGIGAAPSAGDLLAGDQTATPTAADLLGYIQGDDLGDDALGGWFSKLRKRAKRIGRLAKSVARAKAFRLAVGGAAIAFPALAPAAVALEAANRVLDQYESGSRTARKLAQQTIRATRAAAKAGDPGAQRALHALRVTHRARGGRKPATAGKPVTLLLPSGRRVKARLL